MSTLKLKKKSPTDAAAPTGPDDRTPGLRRTPVRGVAAARKRPTLAQAQAARAERAAALAEQRAADAQAAERAAERPRAAPRRRDDEPRPRADARPPAPAPARPPAPRPASAQLAPPADWIRLSKRMSELGLASRREADEWIAHGWVRVGGQIISELGARVPPDATVEIDPQARQQQAQLVTILLNKPIGLVSGQAEDGYQPAVSLVRPDTHWREDPSRLAFNRAHLRHLAPAGRLDIDSTGLLVLTQDGRIAKQLIGEDSGVEKEYLVRVSWLENPQAENLSAVFPPEKLALLRHGLRLDEVALKPAKVSWQNEQQLRFVLREGKKRQIRRMCELVGLKVTALKRVRMGRVALGPLPLGQWRYLGPHEVF